MAIGIKDCETDFASVIVGKRREMDLCTQVRAVTLGLLGDKDSFRTEIEGRNAGRLCHFQPNITVQSSIDIEISSEGSDIKSRSIAADHGKSILSRIYIVGYLKGK